MFKSKITKEELNDLPLVAFEGKIVLVETPEQVIEAAKALNECKYLGVDTETRPSFTRGIRYKISLLQLSNLETCYLFRINKIGLPTSIADILANKNIQKIGLALKDDFAGLNKVTRFKPNNFVDLQAIAKDYGILELGLQKIFAIVFGSKISKAQQLSNWESIQLTEQQKRYAATDAWASLLIYIQLLHEEKISKKELDKLVAEAMDAQIKHQQDLARLRIVTQQ